MGVDRSIRRAEWLAGRVLAVVAVVLVGALVSAPTTSAAVLVPVAVVANPADLPAPFLIDESGESRLGDDGRYPLESVFARSVPPFSAFEVSYRAVSPAGPGSIWSVAAVFSDAPTATKAVGAAPALISYLVGASTVTPARLSTPSPVSKAQSYAATGLDRGQVAPASAIVWSSGPVLAVVVVAGSGSARVVERVARRQQRRIRVALAGRALSPAAELVADPRFVRVRPDDPVRVVVPAPAGGPVAINGSGRWDLGHLGYGEATYRPGGRPLVVLYPILLPLDAAQGPTRFWLLHLHLRVQVASPLRPFYGVFSGYVGDGVAVRTGAIVVFDPVRKRYVVVTDNGRGERQINASATFDVSGSQYPIISSICPGPTMLTISIEALTEAVTVLADTALEVTSTPYLGFEPSAPIPACGAPLVPATTRPS